MDAIVVENVSKHFRRRRLHHTTLKSELTQWFKGRRRAARANITPVLSEIDLSIPHGTTLGIIGRNGSGKSTLLKLITGIYAPSSGAIRVDGRISALLELGAGFHPDFSGRENILINGIILGMSRSEIRARVPEIISFCELGDFIDEPVRTYSSGMYMRLAFAIATHVDPDILLIDEILAVGDSHFARKSRGKMDEFKELGKTIILVTHDLGTVEHWCDRAIWIDKGKVAASGAPQYVVDRYRQEVANADALGTTSTAEKTPEAAKSLKLGDDQSSSRWGSFEAEITGVRIANGNGLTSGAFNCEDSLTIALDFECKKAVRNVSFHATVLRMDGLPVWDTMATGQEMALPLPAPVRGRIELHIPRIGLADGDYQLSVGMFALDEGRYYDFHKSLYRFSVRSAVPEFGVVKLRHVWRFVGDSSSILPSVEPAACDSGRC